MNACLCKIIFDVYYLDSNSWTKPEELVLRSAEKKEGEGHEHLIPSVEFYDIPQHLSVLGEMIKDFSLQEPLLLVGNQGVGKNKLVDTFLERLRFDPHCLPQFFLTITNRLPRQYVQLHRDTTVQTLTLQPSLREGRIVWEDSPLVIAAREGHVLVVDEADKCPLEVVCVLKSLIDGEMNLSDGRKILDLNRFPYTSPLPPNIIPLHPNFRLIVLANRPGSFSFHCVSFVTN